MSAELGDRHVAYVESVAFRRVGGEGRVHIRQLASGADRVVYKARSGGANFANVTRPAYIAAPQAFVWARTNMGSGRGNRLVRYTLSGSKLAYDAATVRYNSTSWAGGALGAVYATSETGEETRRRVRRRPGQLLLGRHLRPVVVHTGSVTAARSMFLPAALLATLASGAAVALAAPAPTLRAPREVRVGQAVTATARDLVPGHYRLYIAMTTSQGAGGRPITCLAAVSPRVDVPDGDRTFRGKIPAKLTCYQGKAIGTVRTTPGAYRFQVASPIGPGMFSARKSFLKRRVSVVR